jgi:hypothetical protein
MRKFLLITIPVCLLLIAFMPAQILKTKLKITVRNELGNAEENVAVQLFLTEEDYRKETNPATPVAFTDEKGEVKFNELVPRVYFVNAEKDDMNNVGAGVQTNKLEEKKLNKVTIIIE